MDGWGLGSTFGDNLVLLDKSSFAEHMDKIDNRPQIVATVYEWSNPTTPFLPSWSEEWRMSAENEIQIDLFHLQRVGENVLIVNTGDVIESDMSWSTSWYDLLKNFLIPWHLEKIDVTITNEGVVHNIVFFPNVILYENTDFAFLEIDIRHIGKLSPWGSISLAIALILLVYPTIKKKF